MGLDINRMTEKQKRMLKWSKDKLILKVLNLQQQINLLREKHENNL